MKMFFTVPAVSDERVKEMATAYYAWLLKGSKLPVRIFSFVVVSLGILNFFGNGNRGVGVIVLVLGIALFFKSLSFSRSAAGQYLNLVKSLPEVSRERTMTLDDEGMEEFIDGASRFFLSWTVVTGVIEASGFYVLVSGRVMRFPLERTWFTEEQDEELLALFKARGIPFLK